MTEMTLNHPRTTRAPQIPYQHRFQVTESPIPEKPVADHCPHCQAALVRKSEPHTLQRLKLSVGQLFAALFAIVFSVLRLARLIVAMAFCVVGLVGFRLQNISRKIVHPNDARLLPLREQNRE